MAARPRRPIRPPAPRHRGRRQRRRGFPDSADQWSYAVLPLGVKPEIIRASTLPSLKTVQVLSAGVDHILPYIPGRYHALQRPRRPHPGHRRVDGRPDRRQPRDFPRFPAAQQRGPLGPHASDAGRRQAGADRRLRRIGAAVERRLAGFEVAVDRVARRARDGVHAVEDLPELLPKADVVFILVPSPPRPGSWSTPSSCLQDGALLVNAARGEIVDTGALLAELRPGGSGPRSTSPTPSRCRPGTRCGTPPACCSHRTSAAPRLSHRGRTGSSPPSWPGSRPGSRSRTSSAPSGVLDRRRAAVRRRRPSVGEPA